MKPRHLQSRIWDDGEPRGTAGSPILTAIGGEGFDHVCVLVTRCSFGTAACAASRSEACTRCLSSVGEAWLQRGVDRHT